MRSGDKLGVKNNRRRSKNVLAQLLQAGPAVNQFVNAHQPPKLAFWNRWIKMNKHASSGFVK